MRSFPWKRAARWAGELAMSVALASAIVLFAYQPVRVEGSSMMPALVDDERLFINKFLYRLGVGEVQRGDLVVFQSPTEPGKSYIKRIIGLPGDTVELRGGVVWLNGGQLEEPYVPAEYRDQSNLEPVRVPPGHYFVLGDHRNASNDSRVWGPVPKQTIYGKAVFAYWPPERMGRLD
jgi:signal peptidase I